MKPSMKKLLLMCLFLGAFSLVNVLLAQYANEKYVQAQSNRGRDLATPSYAHRISLDVEEVSLRQALQTFTQLSGYPVNFEDRLVGGITSVSYRGYNELISGVLVNLLKEHGLGYTVSDDNEFVIVKKEAMPLDTGSIVGTVTDARTGDPLPGANVTLQGTSFGAATSEDGHFMIENVPPGSYVLEVSFIGYRKASRSQSVVVGESVTADFELTEVVFSMDDVVVTANRDPRTMLKVAENITVVSMSEIEQLPVHTVSEALYYTPGVHMNPRGGVGQTVLPSIYGAPHRNVLVLVDGVPINDQAEGFGDVAQIPSENVDRIEIVKGAGSSQWGSAIGGVINIITKSPQDKNQKIGGDVTVGYGKWNTQDFRLSVSGNLDGWGYVLSGSRLTSEDFSDGSGQKLNRSNTDSFKGFAKIVTPEWRNAQLTAAYFQSDLEHGMFENPVFGQWRKVDTKMKIGRANLVYKPQEKLDIDLNFEYNTRDGIVEMFMLDTSDFFGNLKLDETTWTMKGKVGADVATSNRLIAGVDYLNSEFSFGRIFGPIVSGPDDYSLQETAVYFNDEQTLGNLSVTVGARYDNNSEFGSEFSPSVGVVLNSSKIRSLVRASVAKVFDPPTLLFRYMDSNPALGTAGNPDLKAEKALAFNIGVESHYLDFVWTKITLFKLDMENLISFEAVTDTNDAQFGLQKAVNVGEAVRRGVEIELGLEFPHGLSLLGGATLIEAKDQVSGQSIKGIPTQTLDVGLTYASPAGLTVNVKGRYVNQNEDPALGQIPGIVLNNKALIWDAKASYVFKLRQTSLTSYLSLHNITSKKLGIEPFYHVPGRWLEGGIRLGF